MTFIADFVPGFYSLRVVADPDNIISETNELNNEISSDNPIFNMTLYVKYTLLIVDDDGSANNGGANYNVTSNMTAAMDYLGYNYTLYTVNPTTGDGPPESIITNYRATIWLCGETSTSTLTSTDQAVLRSYVNNDSGQLWVIGQDVLADDP